MSLLAFALLCGGLVTGTAIGAAFSGRYPGLYERCYVTEEGHAVLIEEGTASWVAKLLFVLACGTTLGLSITAAFRLPQQPDAPGCECEAAEVEGHSHRPGGTRKPGDLEVPAYAFAPGVLLPLSGREQRQTQRQEDQGSLQIQIGRGSNSSSEGSAAHQRHGDVPPVSLPLAELHAPPVASPVRLQLNPRGRA